MMSSTAAMTLADRGRMRPDEKQSLQLHALHLATEVHANRGAAGGRARGRHRRGHRATKAMLECVMFALTVHAMSCDNL